METAKENLVSGLQMGVEAFLAFMGKESDETVRLYFTIGGEKMDVVLEEIVRVKECKPFCELQGE